MLFPHRKEEWLRDTISLSGIADLLKKHGIEDGFIVDGIVEKGYSSNDIDIIIDAKFLASFRFMKLLLF